VVPRSLAVVLCALALAGTVGCGGDDEEASNTGDTAPELTVPDDDTSTETETTDTSAETTIAPPPETQPAPAPAPDSPQNDTPPPPGSPAERFEEFCAENPGAC
jgi:hypothetical protein